MAQLLGVCAEEISEKGEDPGGKIRRMTWQKREPKTCVKPVKSHESGARAEKKRASPINSGEGGHLQTAGYPMEKERKLLAAFRRGDNETGNALLKELMNDVLDRAPLNFEIIRFRAIELAVLLARAAVNKNDSGDEARDAWGRYLRRIQESKTAGEVTENLYFAADRMTGRIFSFQGVRHSSVLRRAERFIWENYTRKISLDEISKVTGLSAPYFSTIFSEEMGENFSSYLNRLRVERATTLLTETGKALGEIASLCGFEDQSWFSKIFKAYTGISPGKFRKAGITAAVLVPGKNIQDSRTSSETGFPSSE
jgi:AraC-like DNA-binding protein